jgi:hypothetical protein
MIKRGTIIFGRMLPCIRRKAGHLECLEMSRGPIYSQAISSRPAASGCRIAKLAEWTHKVVVKIETSIPPTERIHAWHFGRPRRHCLLGFRVDRHRVLLADFRGRCHRDAWSTAGSGWCHYCRSIIRHVCWLRGCRGARALHARDVGRNSAQLAAGEQDHKGFSSGFGERLCLVNLVVGIQHEAGKKQFVKQGQVGWPMGNGGRGRSL